MANEKSNNVRILQSTQKNNLPPLAHAAIGFLVGAAVIIVVGLGYFYLSSDDQPANTEMTTSAPTEDKAETEATTAPRQSENEQSSAEKALQSVHAMDEKDQDNGLYSNDLATAFNHGNTAKVTQPVQAVANNRSPFEITQPQRPVVAATTTVKQHIPTTLVKPKAAPTTAKVTKPTEPSTKAVKEDGHFEEPMGGTQISETKRPKVVATTNTANATVSATVSP